MRRDSEDEDDLIDTSNPIFTDQDNVRTYQRQTTGEGMEASDDYAEELKHTDIEEKKILHKRKRRNPKIEEITFDLDHFFKQKKRFKPSDMLMGG